MHSGFADWFQLAVLACWLGLGVWRVLVQYDRGGRVIVVDSQRTAADKAKDLLAGLCLIAWWYEVVAQAGLLRLHVIPAPLRVAILDGALLKAVGMLLWLLGLGAYALAMREMGASWRIGIDRFAPGTMVTTGIFARSRNPIYLSFDLGALASFLVTGGDRRVTLPALGGAARGSPARPDPPRGALSRIGVCGRLPQLP
jgi:hypothetical protein